MLHVSNVIEKGILVCSVFQKQVETNETNDPYSDTVYLSADTVYLDGAENQ